MRPDGWPREHTNIPGSIEKTWQTSGATTGRTSSAPQEERCPSCGEVLVTDTLERCVSCRAELR